MLIVFDCDGVVVDSMGLHNEVEIEYYERFEVHITNDDLSIRFAGVPQDEVLRVLELEWGCKFPHDAEAEIDRNKEEVMTKRLKAIPGIRLALEGLKDIPKCIASSTRLDGVRHSLDIVKLREFFEPNIFCAEMVARGKPFPDLFLYAAKNMSVDPANCIVIEDSISGVKAARAAGMRALGFTGGSHTYNEHAANLKDAGAELAFSDMSELPRLIA